MRNCGFHIHVYFSNKVERFPLLPAAFATKHHFQRIHFSQQLTVSTCEMLILAATQRRNAWIYTEFKRSLKHITMTLTARCHSDRSHS